MRPEHWFYTIPLRLRSLLRRHEVEQDLDEELMYHVEQKTAENIARGLSLKEARRRALLAMNGIERTKEECRETRRVRFLEDLAQDLRYGLRMLRKNPGFSVVAILTLALGIGANTAIFSAMHTLLLKPLPFPDPQRLVFLWCRQPARGIPALPASVPDYLDWQRKLNSFESIAGYWGAEFALKSGTQARRVTAIRTFASYFNVLGVQPLLGRTFSESEQRWGQHRVVVISLSLWKNLFDGDPAVVGRTISMDAEPYTVIGVLPAQMSALNPQVQLWVPVAVPPGGTIRRVNRFMRVIGRLKPGVPQAKAEAEFAALMSSLAAAYDEDKGIEPYLVPIRAQITDARTRAALLALFGAASLLLLIACINLANLLSARAIVRGTEIAVRAALGASRLRLARQLMTEHMVLAVCGGLVGVLVAIAGVGFLRDLAVRQLPRAANMRIDGTVLAFTAALALVTGLLFGILPAWRVSRLDLHDTLKLAGRGVASVASRPRRLLVAAETALASALLICAGLLINSFSRLNAVDPGFRTAGVLTAGIDLPTAHFPEDGKRSEFFRDLLDRISHIPGVSETGITETLPLHPGNMWWTGFVRQNHPLASWENVPTVSFQHVSQGYFSTLGIPLLRGRFFTEQDRLGSEPVAIIGETLRRRFFANEDPIGAHIGLGAGTKEWLTVVGVVGDVTLESLDRNPPPMVYAAVWQGANGGVPSYVILAARTGLDLSTFTSMLRTQVQQMDPDLAVAEIEPLPAIVSESLDQPRLITLLLTLFAVLGTLLAAIGTYGVLSHFVVQRTHEIGIRMALGAHRGQVLGAIMLNGLGTALAGIGVGTALGLAGAQALRTLLFGVHPLDPLTYGGAIVLLTGVAALASYLPARRATHVDPMVALRFE